MCGCCLSRTLEILLADWEISSNTQVKNRACVPCMAEQTGVHDVVFHAEGRTYVSDHALELILPVLMEREEEEGKGKGRRWQVSRKNKIKSIAGSQETWPVRTHQRRVGRRERGILSDGPSNPAVDSLGAWWQRVSLPFALPSRLVPIAASRRLGSVWQNVVADGKALAACSPSRAWQRRVRPVHGRCGRLWRLRTVATSACRLLLQWVGRRAEMQCRRCAAVSWTRK